MDRKEGKKKGKSERIGLGLLGAEYRGVGEGSGGGVWRGAAWRDVAACGMDALFTEVTESAHGRTHAREGRAGAGAVPGVEQSVGVRAGVRAEV